MSKYLEFQPNIIFSPYIVNIPSPTGKIKYNYEITKSLTDVKLPECDYRLELSDTPSIKSFNIINCKIERNGLNKKFRYVEILIEAKVNDDLKSIACNPNALANTLIKFLKEI